jgi:hypothetical protein
MMKHLGISSSAVIVAGILLTGLAASPVSATVLCKAAPNAAGECATKAGNYLKGQVFKSSSSVSTFTTVEGGQEKITCKSELEFEQLLSSGTEVPVSVTKLEFTTCSTDPGGLICNLTTEKLPATGSITATDDKGSGHLVISSEVRVAYECPLQKCVINLKSGTLSITGATTASLTALEVSTTTVMKPGWENCPKATLWDDTLALFSPKALWVGTVMD